MRRICLVLFVLLLGLEAQASLRMTSYRWRNDDGNETTATWRAAQNTPITITNTDDLLRLRVALDNDNGLSEPEIVDGMLEYSSDNGVTWTSITNSATNDFVFGTSALVAHNAATTQQLTGTLGTYTAGKIINGVPNAASNTSINDFFYSEYEWVLRPTVNTKPMAKYFFRIEYFGDTEINMPTLNTGCINTSITGFTESFHCGPGAVTLDATGPPGVIISWRDPNNVEVHRGNIFTTPILTQTTIYKAIPLRVYGNNQECFGNAVDVKASIFPVPTVSIGDDKTVCEGTNVLLSAVPNNHRNYLWSNNQTFTNISVTATGTYFVTIEDYNGCKASDTMRLVVNPKPIIELGNDTAICSGEVVELDADPLGLNLTVLWNDNVDSAKRSISTPGDYSVQVTNSFNCTSIDNIKIALKDDPVSDGLNIFYQFDNTYFFEVKNAKYYSRMEWDLGDGSPLRTEESFTHTYPDTKRYNIKLYLYSTCDTSKRVEFNHTLDALSTNQLKANQYKLYPNPSSNLLNLETDNGSISEVIVYDIVGKQLQLPITKLSANKLQINTSNLTSGLYLIQVENDGQVHRMKFEIIK